MAPLSIDIPWYTSERKPTLNIDCGSSVPGFAGSARLGFGALAPFDCFGGFSFLALDAFGRSGRLIVSIVLGVRPHSEPVEWSTATRIGMVQVPSCQAFQRLAGRYSTKRY